VVVDTNGAQMLIYVTKEAFARERHPGTTYSTDHRAWLIGFIP
jgi:hypothetical protein